ncbi:uncharacterized protein LOC110420939 [Herrania umbratica]|uniref:Uncharacterized protein LOC110420939 n=1 Tax=Herrania umbratica TaxID=108875 RepID=A0A6J1ASR2_9ROSI|nr:uncharacterized protein LOC110420939 [Herrania umbratica]
MEKASQPLQEFGGKEDDEDLLTLSLSTGPRSSAPAPPSSPFVQETHQLICLPSTPVPLSPPTSFFQQFLSIPQAPPLPPYHNYQTHSPNLNPDHNATVPQEIASTSRPCRSRRNPFQTPKQGKTDTVPAPYPWATTQRATVHSLDYLLSHNITTISGEVKCKKCEKIYKIEYDLQQKFTEVASFISRNKLSMHDRAPSDWMYPTLPSCEFCGSYLKPVLPKKKSINWLFLLLGQMLGCCKLSELKYFCKHTHNHRTGAKDRVLYLAYLGLCKQLDPKGPFDI